MIQIMMRALIILKSNRRVRRKSLRCGDLGFSSRRDLAITAVLNVLMDLNPCGHKTVLVQL
jgi:hypothetical protein